MNPGAARKHAAASRRRGLVPRAWCRHFLLTESSPPPARVRWRHRDSGSCVCRGQAVLVCGELRMPSPGRLAIGQMHRWRRLGSMAFVQVCAAVLKCDLLSGSSVPYQQGVLRGCAACAYSSRGRQVRCFPCGLTGREGSVIERQRAGCERSLRQRIACTGVWPRCGLCGRDLGRVGTTGGTGAACCGAAHGGSKLGRRSVRSGQEWTCG